MDKLKEKIKRDGAEEKDFPMLNITQTDSSHFEVMIAICIDKLIRNEGDIFISRMVPMKDRFLKTEVTGGPYAIKNANGNTPARPLEVAYCHLQSRRRLWRWPSSEKRDDSCSWNDLVVVSRARVLSCGR